ncbi:RRQRL motif-containing zinc-binding protein [Pseudonocardia sp. H11422]|uniref:RRQRL motif-containing zinc-binding protein n=1 Tax=Pseudonocardia sp. H11422 TaxID=2835866 RepID=UPI001BDD5DB3|nr:RRQRL motif-containing zinc-binding protein [Pseudonocardia sp. H11422]
MAGLVEMWDGRWVLGRIEDGLPTFRWGWVPEGLATRRQLRALGLRPGGQDPVAQIKWRRGRRWAGLYRVDLAMPRRTPTAAQLAAVGAALAARRRCVGCGRDAGYVVPRVERLCGDCMDNTTASQEQRFVVNTFSREHTAQQQDAA